MKKYLKQKMLFVGFILYVGLFFSVPVQAEGMITIDANRKYEGMNASFSKGYEPSIKKDTMSLVIPFVIKQKTEGNKILVGVSFEREENSPFYYKNYQKRVKKSEEGIYLYQCKVKLKKDRVNGQYPLYLLVQAQVSGESIQQEFTIYVEITDGATKVSPGNQPDEKQDFFGENDMSEDIILSEPEEGNNQPFQDSEPKETVTHQPRVMINTNSLQGTSLQAETEVLWSLSVKNCSSSQSMENVKITMLTENKNISFEKTSWYFARSQPGAVMDLSQNITAGKKAEDTISVQFQFEYEDKKGTAYTSTEMVNLFVTQASKAELADISFPESVYESDTNFLTFQIQNTGLTIIYNVRVKFEGKGLFPEKELFVGNLEAGSFADGEISVFTGNLAMDNQGTVIDENEKKYGNTLGIVTFSYENEQGEIVETSQEVQTAIKKPQIVELKVEKEVPKTNQWWITILVGIFLVLCCIIIWLYLRMKHYRNILNGRKL